MKSFILALVVLKTIFFSSLLSQAQNRSYRLLSKLQCDSVKLFYFNCDPNPKLEENNLLNDTTLVDVNQNWAYTVSQVSFKLSEVEISDMLKVVKNISNDKVTSDPSGCYTPRMGIVFFKGRLATAHIDICLECDKMMSEIFTDKHKIQLRDVPGTIGPKTVRFFERLCSKYKLKGCVVK